MNELSTCAICEKGYLNKKSLEEHMRADHTLTEVSACTNCQKRYNCKKDLEEHMQTEHETTRHLNKNKQS